MVQRKRKLLATVEEASNPPERLEDGQEIARVKQVAGSNLYLVQLPSDTELLVELPSRFRSTLWIKRGGYVVIDTRAFAERINKLDGEIVNVIFEEKQWKKMPYW